MRRLSRLILVILVLQTVILALLTSITLSKAETACPHTAQRSVAEYVG